MKTAKSHGELQAEQGLPQSHRTECAPRSTAHSPVGEALASQLVDALPTPIAVLDVDGRVLMVNAAWRLAARGPAAEFFGERLTEGATYLDLANWTPSTPDGRTVDLLNGVRRVISGEQPAFHMEFAARTNVEDRWYQIHVTPLRDGGPPHRVSVAHEDITERVRAEQLQSEEEERYRRLVENLPDALLVHDGDTILYANPAAQRMFGGAKNLELRGEKVLRLVEPAHHERVKRRFRDILEDGGLAPLAEVRLVRLDGEVFDGEAIGTRSIYGHRRVIQAVVREVTERKRAQRALLENEERFRVALTNSRVVVFNQDLDLKYTWVFNPQLGLHVNDIIGHRDEDLFAPEDAVMLTAIKRRVLQTGIGARDEVRLPGQHGVHCFELIVEPLRNPDGAVVGVTCAASDITDIQAANEELQRRKEMLQRVFDHIPVMLCLIDPGGRIALVNREWERVLGWEPHEYNDASIWEKIYPDRDYCRYVHQEIQSCTGRWGDFKCRVRDGREIDTTWANVRLSDGSIIGIGQDITERRRAEAALRENEQRFRHLADQVPVTIWMTDAAGGCTYVSRQWLELTGSEERDSLGDGWAQFVHPDDARRIRATQDAGAAAGEVTGSEFRVRRRDGTWRWMKYHGLPRFGADGAFLGYVGTTDDITDFKNSQHLIELQRRVLGLIATGSGLPAVLDELCRLSQELVPGSACGVWTFDGPVHSLQFLAGPDVPENLRMRLGAAGVIAGEMAGEPTPLIPSDAGSSGGWVLPVMSDSQVPLGVVAFLCPDHREPSANDIWVTRTAVELASISLHHAAAETALRESERTMRTLLGNLLGIAYRCRNDPNWSMEFLSSGCYALTGYHPERFLGEDAKPFADLIHPHDREWVWRTVQEALKAHNPFQLEYRLRTAEGRDKWVWEQGCGVYDEAGTLRFLEGYIADITDRKLGEQSARERYAEVAHALRVSSIGEIAGSIAHELNQPLAAINNYCNGSVMMMDRGNLSEEQTAEAFRRISVQAERAGQILHRVNRFVRKEETAHQVFDLHDMVRSAMDLIAMELRQAKVDVQLDLDARDSRVCVDSVQIEQVLVNLCRNAQEAMASTPADRRKLRIRTESRAGEVETIVFDRGCGCPPEVLNRLFEPFYSSKPQGMGLGLPICKSIIEAHGGRVWATPNSEGGMALHFILPTHKGE